MQTVTHVILTRGVNKPYVEIPEGVTHIGNEVFLNLAIEHVILPSTLIKIGNAAFSGCTKLLSVNFSRCTDLQEIGTAAFSGCTNLRHVHLGNCGKLRTLEAAVFRNCENLVLFIPRNVTSFFGDCLNGVKCVALPSFALSACGARAMLLPINVRTQMVSRLMGQHGVYGLFVHNYDKFSDVFDAIGQLNVLWIESLRRQSQIRQRLTWTPEMILVESQTKNRVIELWGKLGFISVLGLDRLFRVASPIVRDGERLVAMRSYQSQPEETKLFKNILDTFGVNEPVSSPADVGSRLTAKLRL